MNSKCSYTSYNKNDNDLLRVAGSSDIFNISDEYCDLKVDVLTEKYYGARIWGQIKDESGNVIQEALVKLVKVNINNSKINYINIANCISDKNGFYQFEVKSNIDEYPYKILVSKSVSEH